MKRVLAGVVALLLVPPDEHARAKLIEVSLIVNGSFEDGPDLGAETFQALNPGARDLRGWIVTRGQIDVIGTHWQHAHGQRSLDLHGSPGIGGVKQTFATRPGQRYRVTLSLSGNPQPNTGPVRKTITVRAANDQTDFTFDTTGTTQKNMGWQVQTWEFVANAPETTLEIHSNMTEGPFAGPAIDHVSVLPLR
jgi:choice-of-anchor C domain-containing protein